MGDSSKTTGIGVPVSCLILQEEVQEVFDAVEENDLNTISRFIKKYGINNIRDTRDIGVSR